MTQAFCAIVATPKFKLGIRTRGELVREIVFLPPEATTLTPTNAVSELAAAQIGAYIKDPHHVFAMPLQKAGTPFQQRVWAAISAVPTGSVARYHELAAACGSHARAVGQACGANPFPLIVPCHRIVSASGLGGFAHTKDAWLLAAKRWLLSHEAAI